MRKQGTIARWDAARGFGFIRSQGASADTFFHLRDLRGGLQPREGLLVSFEEIHVGGKGPRALAVQAIGEPPARATGHAPGHAQARSPARLQAENRSAPRRQRARQAGTPAAGFAFRVMLPVFAAYGALLLWAVWRTLLPWWILPASFVLNVFTFWMYWVDKNAAQTGRWRTPENTLQMLALAGGWPGAWMAQQVLRHKSSKQPFRVVYWLTVVLHSLAVGAWLFWPPFRAALSALR